MKTSEVKISPRFVEDLSKVTGRVAVNERCPKCFALGQAHLVIDDRQMACLKCRTVFVTEAYMRFVLENMDAILAKPDLRCEICGEFEGKNAMSLQTHKRHCAKRHAEAA